MLKKSEKNEKMPEIIIPSSNKKKNNGIHISDISFLLNTKITAALFTILFAVLLKEVQFGKPILCDIISESRDENFSCWEKRTLAYSNKTGKFYVIVLNEL